MRVLAIILIVAFAIAGIIFGALNADLVYYDFAFAHAGLPKGAALIAALALGWILGGVSVWLLSAYPLRRRLARHERARPTRTEQTDEKRDLAPSQ